MKETMEVFHPDRGGGARMIFVEEWPQYRSKGFVEKKKPEPIKIVEPEPEEDE